MRVDLISPYGTRARVSASTAVSMRRYGWQEPGASLGSAPDADRPAKSASRGAWAAYAESVGIDTSELTKKQIIETLG